MRDELLGIIGVAVESAVGVQSDDGSEPQAIVLLTLNVTPIPRPGEEYDPDDITVAQYALASAAIPEFTALLHDAAERAEADRAIVEQETTPDEYPPGHPRPLVEVLADSEEWQPESSPPTTGTPAP